MKFPQDGLLWTCTPLVSSSARFKFLPYVALHRKLYPLSLTKCSLSVFLKGTTVGSLQLYQPEEISVPDPRAAAVLAAADAAQSSLKTNMEHFKVC